MIENRVRKLNIEEDRLQKQIMIANKHSNFADSVRERKEEDIRQHNEAMRNEQERIERQMASNNRRREQNLANINYHQKAIFDNCVTSRDNLNSFLKSGYDNFFSEKLHEHKMRSENAADMYN